MSLVEDETSYTSMRGSFVDGQSWFDGEILGSEIITNGTMEADSNWNDHNLEGGDTQARYDHVADPDGVGAAHGGQYSRKINVDADDEGMRSDPIAVTVGVLYKIEGYYYIISGSVRFHRHNARLDINSGTLSTTGRWCKFTQYLTAISTGVEYIKGVSVGGAAVAYWDDISIKPVTSLSTQSFDNHLVIVGDGAGTEKFAYGYAGAAATGEAKTALSNNVTAITKANPGVVSSTAHGLVVGDLVYFSGLNEMTELNDTYKTVTVLDSANTFSINDTSGYGAAETTGGACANEVTEPHQCAVKIYKERGLVNEGWREIGAGINYNAGSAWNIAVHSIKEGAWWKSPLFLEYMENEL